MSVIDGSTKRRETNPLLKELFILFSLIIIIVCLPGQKLIKIRIISILNCILSFDLPDQVMEVPDTKLIEEFEVIGVSIPSEDDIDKCKHIRWCMDTLRQSHCDTASLSWKI